MLCETYQRSEEPVLQDEGNLITGCGNALGSLV